MKIKQSLLVLVSTLLVLISTNSYAGREGISFYYGLGLGAAFIDGDQGSSTTWPKGDIILGIEEDGWALEGIAFATTEEEEDTLSGSLVGLAYRSIDTKDSYYKIKVSSTKLDVEESGITDDFKTSGTTYSIGFGLRMGREERLEIEYGYYNSSDIDDPMHLLMFTYLWGGAKYHGKSF